MIRKHAKIIFSLDIEFKVTREIARLRQILFQFRNMDIAGK